MWLESSSANAVNLVKKSATRYRSRDIEFFLGDYFFWRALYIVQIKRYSRRHQDAWASIAGLGKGKNEVGLRLVCG